MFKLTYASDESPRVGYLALLNHVEHPIVRTIKIGSDDWVMADLDENDSVVGIEVIGWTGDFEVECQNQQGEK